MSREKKVQAIDRLQDTFSKCSIGILTDYRGLSAPEITVLRRKLGEASIEYKVVKNTMARFAGERAGRSDLVNLFEGPIAIAFGYDDITKPAKILTDYINTSQVNLSIKGGFLSDRLLASEDIATLSTLPTRDILLAKVLGGMQSPIATLVSCLNAPIKGIMGVLQARIKLLKGE
ncbi:50S ribosomal protein L10 [Chloroflexota bacterium]